MGNACCNEKGAEPGSIDKQPKSMQRTEDVRLNQPFAQETNGKAHHIHHDNTHHLDGIHHSEIENFNKEPNQFLGLDQVILRLIEKNTFHTLQSADTRIPYKKIEGIGQDGRKYRYFGQIDSQKKNGRGQLQILDKDGKNAEFIICNFVDDVASGDGAVYFPNGDYFKGKLVAGQPKEGIMYLNNGDRYEGSLVNNLYDGSGTLYYADRRKYRGTLKAGKKHGKGTFNWTDGSFYEGAWENGIQQGHGKYVDAQKIVHEGEFVQGKKVKDSH